MLAQEFNYTQSYVDTHINAPSMRGLIKYRNNYPPASLSLRQILIFLGAVEPPKQIKNRKAKNTLSTESLENISKDFTSVKVDDTKFQQDLALLRRPSKY